jgi:DNA modification methylase/ParB-like chromosome segregation protein Spo0J
MQTMMLPVDAIHIRTRQRTEDEATRKHILELARDIQENGLIHAPQIDVNRELVAGWCRLSAIKMIACEYYYAGSKVAPGFIPVTVTHMTEEKDLHRLELMENLRRKNLSPMDEAKAIAKLHKFNEEQHSGNWTREETGAALDQLRGDTPRQPAARRSEVSDALLLAPFENDPDVVRASTRKEAVSIARKKMEQQLTATLGEFYKPESSDHELLEGDCRIILPTLAEGSFSGIVCDPPYGIEAQDFGDQTMKGGHKYDDSAEYALSVIEAILVEGYRVCTPTAHLYMFCDLEHFYPIRELAVRAGWQAFPSPLIWNKPNIGHAPWPGYFSRRYEIILFCQKGIRALQRSRSDVFEFPAVTKKLHAAEKPVDLIKEFLSLSFLPGEKILDPCAGGGTIFRAAKLANMRATGIENEPQSVGLCKAAITEA